jgi:hypothetical protein
MLADDHPSGDASSGVEAVIWGGLSSVEHCRALGLDELLESTLAHLEVQQAELRRAIWSGLHGHRGVPERRHTNPCANELPRPIPLDLLDE